MASETTETVFSTWQSLGKLGVSSLDTYGEFPAVYSVREARTAEILKFG